jgi:hypothetical protein
MRTEIVVPFTFDTDPIEQRLQNVGVEEVNKRIDEIITEHVLDVLPKTMSAWNGDVKTDWRAYVDSRMDAFLDEHTQEIVDEAAILMAMRASRRKAWKDVLAEYREEGE